jgi:putative RNA 2'-phosphotransferase
VAIAAGITMTDYELTRISKTLSYHLRHRPDELGLTLGSGGWVAVDELLVALARKGKAVLRTELDEVVARNPKRRFAFDDSGTRIRASQRHSVEVDLELEPVTPPAVLYHGTSQGAIAAIEHEGLKKMRRHHVHLSARLSRTQQALDGRAELRGLGPELGLGSPPGGDRRVGRHIRPG